ncbi:MAG: quinoprotein dehydrogenase-associated putative ABC transporter substrate-binding protein [Proteobacteria bacterium]|nr:quinoprotein dehydrogenase-associated putative ABC transporter substrate-binding protein [Pseudomonadota bacterium]
MKKILLFLCLISTAQFGLAGDLPDKENLKVCADPYMLPFSNQKGEGYENKIAELFAKKLGLGLKYEFFPQRMGFIRNTLKAESEDRPGFKCDLVMSVPSNFELAATTDPYFTSTYVLVYAKGRKLDSITDPSMLSAFVNEQGNKVRFGLTDRGPAQLWVARNSLLGSIAPYQAQPGDPKSNPGLKMLEDIVSDKIDAAIIWGPMAGYHAKKYKDQSELVLLPLIDDPEMPEMRFNYSFSMAVRYGEKAWKEKINKLIKDNQSEIEQILNDYNVPLIK